MEKRAAHSPANKTAQGASRECPCFSCAPLCLRMCVCVCSANGVQIMPEMRGEQGAYAALLPRRAAAPFSYCRLRAGLTASVAPLPLLQSMLSKMLQACRMLLGNQIKLVGKT